MCCYGASARTGVCLFLVCYRPIADYFFALHERAERSYTLRAIKTQDFALFSLRPVPGVPPPSSLAPSSPLPTDLRDTLRVLLVLLRRHGCGGEL